MKNSFEDSLIEGGELMKRGYSFLIDNVGKTIALLTAVISVLVVFTEIGFYDFGTERLTSTAIILCMASYITYFSLEDAGEKLGRDSDEYKKATEKYREAKERIGGESIPELRQYIEQYASEELLYRKKACLLSLGLGYSEYEEYKQGKRVGAKERRKFKIIERMKPIKISVAELLSSEKKNAEVEFTNPERRKGARLVLGLVPSTLCMLFTVSIMLSAKSSMGFADVVEGILRLTTLPVFGLRGYTKGYTYAKSECVFWLETKTRFLNSFLKKKEICK